MFKLALRNVLRQRMRSIVTLAAIVVGVVALILSAGFVEDIVAQLGEALIHSQSGHVQVSRRGFFEAGARSPEKFLIERPEAVRAQLAALAEVDDVLARIGFSGLINNGRADLAIVGEGVEPGREARLGTYLKIKSGRALRDTDAYGILLGDGVASAFRLAPGDRATLIVNSSGGALNTLDFEVVGVFQTFSKDFDARAVRIPLAAAQRLLDTRNVNTFVISLKQTSDTAYAARRTVQLLDSGQFEVKAWYELSDFHDKTVALYERQFGVLRLIILFMVLLSVTNSVNISIAERIGEFGTILALGNRRASTLYTIVAESALLGAIGATLGALLGILLAHLISAIGIPMPPPPNADLGFAAQIRIVPKEIGLAFTIGFFATVAASVMPAWRATRIPIVDALKQNV